MRRETTAREGTGRAANVALALAVAALAAALALQSIRSLDYWWHLRTGEWIARTASVPRIDPYTYTVPGARWIDVHWLHQLSLYAAYSLGGHAGVVVLWKLGLVLALVGAVATVGSRRRPLVTALLLALMLCAAADRFMPRPELPTFVLLAASLALYHRFERRPDGWIYAVVLIQLVWANVHGLFAVGLVVTGLHVAGELARPLLARGIRWGRARRLAAVAALSGLATLVNPNGLDAALYPLRQLRMIDSPEARDVFASLSVELLSPLDPRASPDPLAIGFVVALAALSLAALAWNARRARLVDFGLWLAFAYLAVLAQRNLALFAIAAAVVGIRNANQALHARAVVRAGPGGAAGPPGRAALAATVLAALALLALAFDVARGSFFPRTGSLREPGVGVLDYFHPVGAVDWIARERPKGPIFHYLEDGGYLGWRLGDDYPVMVDGRLEVFGVARLIELRARDGAHFERLDRRYRFGVALVRFNTYAREVIRWLELSRDWRLVFLDEIAALYVRATPGVPFPWREVRVDDPEVFPPLAGPWGLRDFSLRLGRTRALVIYDRVDRARALWEETQRLYPRYVGSPDP